MCVCVCGGFVCVYVSVCVCVRVCAYVCVVCMPHMPPHLYFQHPALEEFFVTLA